MSKIQRLSAALCPGCDGDPCGNCRDVAASILADPAPLLAALAEAGVLREDEQYVTTVDVTPGTMQRWSYDPDRARIERRYVTEWRPADD